MISGASEVQPMIKVGIDQGLYPKISGIRPMVSVLLKSQNVQTSSSYNEIGHKMCGSYGF